MTLKATRVTNDAKALAAWYERTHRKLPWRATRDPYAIWISETMLQQTRVETVIPYYQAFLHQYPTVEALANADFEEVAKLWQGLGYYSRARNLHKAAKVIVEEHGGKIPRSEAEIRALPGIGPYTAGAVQSIAFNLPVPAVDGNVLRVMTRYLGIHEPIETTAVKMTITAEVEQWLQVVQPSVLTQAIMELGATVCTPKSPTCGTCPLGETCTAHESGTEESLPVRKPKQPKRCVDVYALWIEHDGRVLMHRRREEGLLAGMWELPAIEVPVEPRSRKKRSVAKSASGQREVPAEVQSGVESETQSGVAVEVPDEVLPSDVEVKLSSLLDEIHGNVESESNLLTNGDGAVREASLQSFIPLASERHLFSHVDWLVQVVRPVGYYPEYRATQSFGSMLESRGFRFVPRDDLQKLVLPRVYEKLLEVILKEASSAIV